MPSPGGELDVPAILSMAERHLESRLGDLDLPFQLPVIEPLSCLIPGEKAPAVLRDPSKR